VLSSVILTILIYTFSLKPPVLYPFLDSRYLVALPVAFPALLWPLWTSHTPIKQLHHIILRSIQICVLSFVIVTLLIGTIAAFNLLPASQVQNSQTEQITQKLEQLHLTHIYSEYWTCNKLAFLTDEHIICAVLGDGLQTGYNRYLPYLATVRRDPLSAYVFPLQSPQAARLAKLKGQYYQRLIIAGYVIYQHKTP
jgi:hypothetical protein